MDYLNFLTLLLKFPPPYNLGYSYIQMPRFIRQFYCFLLYFSTIHCSQGYYYAFAADSFIWTPCNGSNGTTCTASTSTKGCL